MPANHRGPVRRLFFPLAFSLLVLWRLWLACASPSDSTDLYRNLAFTSHLPDWGFRFYQATASDFGPGFWPVVWPKRPYLYPPAAAVFFAGFSALGLGLAWVKLCLSACDVIAALLLARLGSRGAALLYLASPVSAFYGSHEGQFEPLVAMLIVAAAACASSMSFAACGALVGLGIQVKLHSVLLLPWLVHRCLAAPARARSLARLFAGVLVSAVPFAGFYWHTPDAILLGARYVAVDHHFNPYYWNFFDASWGEWLPAWVTRWMSVSSLMLVLVAAAAARRALFRRELPSEILPFAAFWTILKSVHYVSIHYAIVGNAFTACLLPRRRLALGLLLLQLAADPRCALLLAGTRAVGRDEGDQVRARMARCLVRCDWRAPAP